ncbi:MAG: DUF2500 domain-containing protein [Turicibacter sp.]|nr:DUF2500 domain-containing protein [Turicibacter sp.]
MWEAIFWFLAEVIVEILAFILPEWKPLQQRGRQEILENDGSLQVEWVTVIKKQRLLRFVTFEFPDGKQNRLRASRELYRKIAIGDIGRLTYDERLAYDFQ